MSMRRRTYEWTGSWFKVHCYIIYQILLTYTRTLTLLLLEFNALRMKKYTSLKQLTAKISAQAMDVIVMWTGLSRLEACELQFDNRAEPKLSNLIVMGNCVEYEYSGKPLFLIYWIIISRICITGAKARTNAHLMAIRTVPKFFLYGLVEMMMDSME